MEIKPKELYSHIESMKEDGKTWEQITNELNRLYGKSYGESAYRKPYTWYKRGIKDGLSESELQYKLQEIRRKQKQLSIERSINNEQIRDLAIRDVMHQQMIDALDRSFVPELNSRQKPIETDRDFVIFLGDMHYNGDEEVYDLPELFGTIKQKIVNFVKTYNIKNLTLVELGDLIEGASQRISQYQAIRKGMVAQMQDVQLHYAVFLQELYNETGCHIDFYTVTSSNHTQIRHLGTSRNELVDEDLMRMFKSSIETYFRRDQDKVSVYGDISFKIKLNTNHTVFCAHGHEGNMSPKTLDKNIYARDFYGNIRADYFVFGHYHHFHAETLNSRDDVKRAFLVPALNLNENSTYEEDRLLGSKPGFVILEFDELHGHTTTHHMLID